MNYKKWNRDELLAEVIRLKRRELDLICSGERLDKALRLAKDMMIANDLCLPRTFEVIDKALGENKTKKRYAVWGIDGSFKYKWVANLLRWWRK